MISLLSLASSAQPALNTRTVDEQTYAFYQEKDWDALIALGRNALSSGIDFYYLQYRMGIAWFEKGNYHQAIIHFYKAYETNTTDPLLQEYLYLANLYVNRKQEAKIIAGSMTASHRKRLGFTDDLWLETAEVYVSLDQTNSSDIIDSYQIDTNGLPDGKQYIPKDHRYVGINLYHPVSRGFSIYHGYSNLRKNHFIYTQSNNNPIVADDATSTLNQYYLSGIARVARNLTLITGFHYINIRYPVEATITRGMNSFVITEMESLNDFLGFASLYKHIGSMTLGGTVYYAGLNNARQIQTDAMFTWYPLGNLNLYTVSVFSMQSEKNDLSETNIRNVLFQRIGGKISRSCWLEGSVSFGEIQNFLRYDGLVVFNAMDMIRQQIGGKLIMMLTPNLSANVHYIYSLRRSVFKADMISNQTTNQLEYTSHSFTGGLTWNL